MKKQSKSATKVARKAVSKTAKKSTSKVVAKKASSVAKKTPAVAKSTSQYDAIFQHLVKKGSINTMEAINTYGVLRLSSVIHNLRAGGVKIKTGVHTFKNKNGNTSNVAKYIMG